LYVPAYSARRLPWQDPSPTANCPPQKTPPHLLSHYLRTPKLELPPHLRLRRLRSTRPDFGFWTLDFGPVPKATRERAAGPGSATSAKSSRWPRRCWRTAQSTNWLA